MILSGRLIDECVRRGDIQINPYSLDQLNANSYNLRLDNKLLVYADSMLDCAIENKTIPLDLTSKGFMLEPGELYLGSTMEYTYSPKHVPMLEGRSSLARLGICVHISAGFGDIGFSGKWTLEMTVVKPTIIYPGMQVCQIYYHTIDYHFSDKYRGKYNNAGTVEASKLYREFDRE